MGFKAFLLDLIKKIILKDSVLRGGNWCGGLFVLWVWRCGDGIVGWLGWLAGRLVGWLELEVRLWKGMVR